MDDSPIFAEIVPKKSRTSVYAMDRSFESILSSFAPPAVGILAQHVYGYKPIPEGSSDSEEILERKNAASLGKALYTALGVPMALSCLIYSFLYRSYPRDRERAQMDALIESEMQRLDSDSSLTNREFSEVLMSDSEELYLRDYDSDGIHLDDKEDEKRLLYRQLHSPI